MWDQDRYGTLVHPGLPAPPIPTYLLIETFSFDIFSQAAKAIRDNPIILDGLHPDVMLAAGQSQSALRLSTYVNSYQEDAQIFDGFLIHSGPVLITNTNTKVFGINSEREVAVGGLAYYPLRDLQPGPNSYAYWEVPGTGHTSDSTYVMAQTSYSLGFPLILDDCEYPLADPDFLPKSHAGNAVLYHLNRWVKYDIQPPQADFVEVEEVAGVPTIVRDQYGNALGGVRLPEIEVPIGRFKDVNSGSGKCSSFAAFDLFDGEPAGVTLDDDWDEPTLDELYRNHGAYVSKFVKAARRAVRDGFLLRPDALEAIIKATTSDIGKKP